jgi:hypothetical protein
MFSSKTFVCGAIVAVICGMAVTANADITVLANYRLGESDPGAVAGNLGNDTTVDSSGNGHNLTRYTHSSPAATPTYSSDSGVPGGTLSMDFNAANNDAYSAPLFSTIVDNVGIQAMVKESTPSTGCIAYNGSLNGTGYGLYQMGGTWGFQQSGTGAATTVPIVYNTWTSLAMVRDSGVTTLYVNGVATGATWTDTPGVPTGNFSIGDTRGGVWPDGIEPYNGLIDEVRMFTFAPGHFNVSDLAYTATPEPGPMMLLVTGVLGLLCYAWRRRR